MTEKRKIKKIRAVIGLDKIPEPTVRNMMRSALAGLKANPKIFSNLPVDLNVYETNLNALDASIPAALDGSMTAVALKNKLKDVAINDYTQLAHSVEATANNDLATFLLSGFVPKGTKVKTATEPPSVPAIAYVKMGPKTGEAKIKVPKPTQAVSGDVRYGQVPPGGGLPTTWTEIRFGIWRPIVVSGLTPGVMYTFQARALGAGLTDWSDPVNRMAM